MPGIAWTAVLVMPVTLAVATGLLAASARLALSRPAPPTPARPAGSPLSDAPAWVQAAGTVLAATAVLGLMLLVSHLRDGLRYAVTLSACAGMTGLIAAARGVATRMTLAAVLAAAASAWIAFPGWATADAVTAALVVSVVLQWQPSVSFSRAAVIGAALAFGYDFVQVFLTGAMGQVAGSAAGQWLPVMIVFPVHLGWGAPAVIGLGAGDIAIPAILVTIAGRAGQRAGTTALYRAGVAGYAAGLACALTVLLLSGTALPALVFVVPGVIAAVFLAARRHGCLHELGKSARRPVGADSGEGRLGGSPPARPAQGSRPQPGRRRSPVSRGAHSLAGHIALWQA